METIQFIERILTAHEQADDTPIEISGNLRLLPQIDYSGKMARDAYRGWRWFKHRERLYAGIFDFKIMIGEEGMEHEKLMHEVVSTLPIEAVRKVHSGEDPMEINGLNSTQRNVASHIQAGFIEQELNWGEEPFQSWTYFGDSTKKDELLRSAAPRDYLMVYIEKCIGDASSSGTGIEEAFKKTVLPYITYSEGARNSIVDIPIDRKRKQVFDDFRGYMPSAITGRLTRKWVVPHLERAMAYCTHKGPNPWHPHHRER